MHICGDVSLVLLTSIDMPSVLGMDRRHCPVDPPALSVMLCQSLTPTHLVACNYGLANTSPWPQAWHAPAGTLQWIRLNGIKVATDPPTLTVTTVWCGCLQVLAVGGGMHVTIRNALIANNVADSVVAVLPNSEVNITGSTCRDNTMVFGTVYVRGHLILSNTTFSGNFAHRGGAGVHGMRGTVDIHQNTFTKNTARGAGGAAAFFRTRAKLSEVNFTDNIAAGGGAVALLDGSMTSDKCWFLKNSA